MNTMKPSKPVILTGVRANNNIHIGNYFGAILPIINMAKRRSDEYDINLFIPDLHSFTTPIDHSKLYDSTLNNARVYTAAGLLLDNPSTHLYRQSRIPAHSELAWILDCFTGFGEMSRMTQFKDKGSKGDASVGLFNYPVLMAADILLYGASYVPVGDDQTQHLELTRDIAERMNRKFGKRMDLRFSDLFIVPKPVIQQHQFFGKDQGLRIKDLVNPAKKMSKSDESKSAHKKIMSATTDSIGKVQYDKENQPGISNLLEILTLVRQDAGREVTLEQTANEYFGMNRYGDFKRIVADEVAEFLENFQNRLAAVDERAIEEKLASSEKDMNVVANETLYRVQKAVGLRK